MRDLSERDAVRPAGRRWCGVAAVLLLLATNATAQTGAAAASLTIAAAADLQGVLPLVIGQFQRATGRTVSATYGSSGNFYTQIQHGAPFDLFLSADIDYPNRLITERLVEPESLFRYATGRIVLWWRKDRALDPTRGLEALRDQRVRRIAIANPDHAPYGRAAVAALRKAHLLEQVQAKLVRGENVAQAAQFVESGNADAGIIALSLALSPALQASGAYYEIPATEYPPIVQAAVVVSASRQQPAAREFLRFLRAPEVVSLMATFGFVRPPSDKAAK